MMCTLCRSTVPADALVCPQCGDLVQARVELGAVEPPLRSGALWIALGLAAMMVVFIVVVGVAMGESIQGGPTCALVLLIVGVLAPLLTYSRGRGLSGLLSGSKPRYGVRDLTYLSRLRAESSGGSPPSIRYFATFASLAEFKIDWEQYERLKGCEGQRMVLTYILETHELVEFIPAPPNVG